MLRKLSISHGSQKKIRIKKSFDKDTLETEEAAKKQGEQGFEVPNPHKIGIKKRVQKINDDSKERKKKEHLEKLVRQGEDREENILTAVPGSKKKSLFSVNVRWYVKNGRNALLLPFSLLFYLTIPELRKKKDKRVLWCTIAGILIFVYILVINLLILYLEIGLLKAMGWVLHWYTLFFKVQFIQAPFFVYNLQFLKGPQSHQYFLSSF